VGDGRWDAGDVNYSVCSGMILVLIESNISKKVDKSGNAPSSISIIAYKFFSAPPRPRPYPHQPSSSPSAIVPSEPSSLFLHRQCLHVCWKRRQRLFDAT